MPGEVEGKRQGRFNDSQPTKEGDWPQGMEEEISLGGLLRNWYLGAEKEKVFEGTLGPEDSG